MRQDLLGLALASLLCASIGTQAQPAAPGTDRVEHLLEQLSNASGPSGFEEPVRAIMVREMKPLATAPIRYDGLGDVLAQQGTTGPKIMVDAHMDELGGMVRRVTPAGFLSMQMLGGWLDQALVDQRWIILGAKGPVRAVTGIRDIHVLPAAERNTVFPRDTIFLDVGAKSADEVAALGITPGDPVVPDAPFAEMNGTGNYLGKAWDDRIGCAVLLAAMRRTAREPHANQLVYVATVQEEVGLRGARAATATVRPDIGIAIEGGITGDVPGDKPEETQVKLGGGPGMFLYDSSAIANRKWSPTRERLPPPRASRSRQTSSRATETTPPKCKPAPRARPPSTSSCPSATRTPTTASSTAKTSTRPSICSSACSRAWTQKQSSSCAASRHNLHLPRKLPQAIPRHFPRRFGWFSLNRGLTHPPMLPPGDFPERTLAQPARVLHAKSAVAPHASAVTKGTVQACAPPHFSVQLEPANRVLSDRDPLRQQAQAGDGSQPQAELPRSLR